MSRIAILFLMIVAPALAIFLALLGVETLRTNLLGWFLSAYTGYLLMALSIAIGYSSISGLTAILLFLLPSLFYRVKVEEKLLIEHFGEAYQRYAGRTKRLIPGIW